MLLQSKSQTIGVPDSTASLARQGVYNQRTMAGQMKRYKMELSYGVELAGPVSVGTGATLQESSSDFDSSKPLESVRAAAECFALLVNDFSTNAVPNTLREEFLLELARKLK